MQPTDTGPLTPENFDQRYANLEKATAEINAKYGHTTTPETILSMISQSLQEATAPDPMDPPPTEEGPALSSALETIKAFTEREMSLNLTPETFAQLTDFPDLPPSQKLHPTTIHGAITQIVAQPGDGTRYRIILTECPVDYLGETPQHLLSATTGGKGRSMFITMGYKYIRDGGFYLHPSYVEEKFGPDSTYLSKMVAHLMNLLFSKPYLSVLNRLLESPADERDHLPPVFQTDEAIKAEIANPHAIWNGPAE